MSIEDFLKKHKPLNLYIEYNDHKTSYETVEEYIEERDIKDEEIIDKEECIKNDTIYSLQIYPSTPIRILFNIFFKFRKSDRGNGQFF